MVNYICGCVGSFGTGFAICGLIFTMQLESVASKAGYLNIEGSYYKLVKIKLVEVKND